MHSIVSPRGKSGSTSVLSPRVSRLSPAQFTDDFEQEQDHLDQIESAC